MGHLASGSHCRLVFWYARWRSLILQDILFYLHLMKKINESLPHLSSVTMAICTGHGSVHDKVPGLGALLLPVLGRETRHHSEIDLNLLIEGRGSHLVFESSRNYSVMGIRSVPSEAEH